MKTRDKKRKRQEKKNLWWVVVPIFCLLALVICWSSINKPNTASVMVTDFSPINNQLNTTSRATEDVAQAKPEPNYFLKYLIVSHPSPEISQELLQLINDRVIKLTALNDDAAATSAAGFGIKMQNGQLKPIMSFSMVYLADQRVPLQRKQLDIYHEFHHYKQWRDEIYPRDTFMRHESGHVCTGEEVAILFDAEIDAYVTTSKLAENLGWTDHDRWAKIYRDLGLAHLAQTLARQMANEPLLKPHKDLLFQLANSERYQTERLTEK
jgi:hypothetical protein